MNAAQQRLTEEIAKRSEELDTVVSMECSTEEEVEARSAEVSKLTEEIEKLNGRLAVEERAAAARAKVEERKASVNAAGIVVPQKQKKEIVPVEKAPQLLDMTGFDSHEEMRAAGRALLALYRGDIKELRAVVASTHPIGVNDTLEPDSMGEKSPTYDGKGAELVKGAETFYAAILNMIRYESVAMKLARLVAVRGPKLHLGIADDIQEPDWYLENCEILPIKPKTAGVSVDMNKLGARVQVSNELMADSIYSIVALVGRMFANGFAHKIDKVFFQGDAKISYAGLAPSVAGSATVTAAAATPTVAEITSLMAKVDPNATNRAWVLSSAAWANVQALATSSIGYNVTTAVQQRVFGQPVYITDQLPAKTLALYGDFTAAAAIGYNPDGLVVRSSYERAIEYDQWVAVATQRLGFGLTNNSKNYVAKLMAP